MRMRAWLVLAAIVFGIICLSMMGAEAQSTW